MHDRGKVWLLVCFIQYILFRLLLVVVVYIIYIIALQLYYKSESDRDL